MYSQVGDYTIHQPIGKGGFGVVYKSQHTEGVYAAAKCIDMASILTSSGAQFEISKPLEKVTNELKILKTVNGHENVAWLYDGFSVENNVWIFSELCDVNLQNYLCNTRVNLSHKLKIMKQCISGLVHIHEKEIIHQNIKLENILISTRTKSGNPQVKITDFSLARVLDEAVNGENVSSSYYAQTNYGNRLYKAPELFASQEGCSAVSADVFALGVVYSVILEYASQNRYVKAIRDGSEQRHTGNSSLPCLGMYLNSKFNPSKETSQRLQNLPLHPVEHVLADSSNTARIKELIMAIVAFQPVLRPSSSEINALISDILEQEMEQEPSGTATLSTIPPPVIPRPMI